MIFTEFLREQRFIVTTAKISILVDSVRDTNDVTDWDEVFKNVNFDCFGLSIIKIVHPKISTVYISVV